MENNLGTKDCSGSVKYDDLTNIFWSTLDSPALLKQKPVKRNQAPYITKELSKSIYDKI